MTIIAKNPQEYGLDNIGADTPLEYDSIHVTAPTHLDLIADATLQPVSVIRELNPSLLGRLAPAGFQVNVPKGMATATQEALESVPANSRQAWRLHHVSIGDTLADIARFYHLAPERIVAVNASSDSIEAGDTLLIPALAPVTPVQAVRGRRFSKGQYSLARLHSSRATLARRGHMAASRRVSAHVSTHVSSQAWHRKAEIRTASLAR
jgi:hypothetical protein